MPTTINGLAIKPTMRRMAEMAIVSVLGKVPRKVRRSAAQRYANAAWRDLRGLLPLDTTANRQIVEWVAKEFKKYAESQKHGKTLAGAASTGNDVGSSTSGPAERNPEVSIVHVDEDEGSGELPSAR